MTAGYRRMAARQSSPCNLLIIVLHPNREHRRDASTLGSASCLPQGSNHRIGAHTCTNHTVPCGMALWGGAVPGTSCQATIAPSLRDTSQQALASQGLRPLISLQANFFTPRMADQKLFDICAKCNR